MSVRIFLTTYFAVRKILSVLYSVRKMLISLLLYYFSYVLYIVYVAYCAIAQYEYEPVQYTSTQCYCITVQQKQHRTPHTIITVSQIHPPAVPHRKIFSHAPNNPWEPHPRMPTGLSPISRSWSGLISKATLEFVNLCLPLLSAQAFDGCPFQP